VVNGLKIVFAKIVLETHCLTREAKRMGWKEVGVPVIFIP
jgi:hypothetical protein